MDWLVVTLRFVHVMSGIMWVGAMMFATFLLSPAIGDVGPDGGKVMAALQRRGMMTIMPLLALLTLGSGIWLSLHIYGSMGAMNATAMGRTLSIGATAALLSFIVGLAVVRPAMARAASAATPADAQRYRMRGTAAGRFVALLLLVAAGAMAIARYV